MTKNFFPGFIVILEIFYFFYLSNADVENCGSFKSFGFIVENCGSFKSFGFIYIYIYIDDMDKQWCYHALF